MYRGGSRRSVSRSKSPKGRTISPDPRSHRAEPPAAGRSGPRSPRGYRNEPEGYNRDEHRDSARYNRRDRSPAERHNSPTRDNRGYRRAPEFSRPRDTGFKRNENTKEFFESRKLQREASTLVFWPESDQISDTSEESDLKPKRSKKGLGSDSEDDRRRTKSKSKKKSKSHRKKSDSRSSKSNHGNSRISSMQPYPLNAGGNSAPPLIISISEIDAYEELWVERKIEFNEDSIVGPFPAPNMEQKIDTRSYGGSLLAGEAEAMAAYVQSGKRIPRRGEIGMRSEEIEFFERQGFVMSGNRHQRMNAVRIRKENQIISAEEKRALLNFAQEERAKRENKIIADLREMVNK